MGLGSNGFWPLFGCSFQIFLSLASEKVVVEFFFGLLFFNYRVFMEKKKKRPEGTSFWPLDADHLMDTWTLANRWN